MTLTPTQQAKAEEAANEGAKNCQEQEAYGYAQGFPDGCRYATAELVKLFLSQLNNKNNG